MTQQIAATTTTTPLSAHRTMRDNAARSVQTLQDDLARQQLWSDNARANLHQVEEKISHIEQQRAQHLALLSLAQHERDVAEASRDAALGTDLQAEKELLLAAAQSKISDIYKEMASLAPQLEKLQAEREQAQIAWDACEESLRRIKDRLVIATELHASSDSALREETRTRCLAELEHAKQDAIAKQAVADQAQAHVQQVQADVVRDLAEWPQEAVAVLMEHGVFHDNDDEECRLLQMTLDTVAQLEASADSGVLSRLGGLLRIDVPAELSIVGSRRGQREKVRQRGDDKKGWGLHPSFLRYEQQLLIAEKALAERQQAARQRQVERIMQQVATRQ